MSGYEAEKGNLESDKQDLEQKLHALASQLGQAKHQIGELISDKQHLSWQIKNVSQGLGNIENGKLFLRVCRFIVSICSVDEVKVPLRIVFRTFGRK